MENKLLKKEIVLGIISAGGEGESQGHIPEPIVIKVGVLKSGAILGWGGVGPGGFKKELNYSWSVGEQKYSFDMIELSSVKLPFYDSVFLHYKKLKNFNVVIISGVQDEQILCGAPIIRNTPRMKLLLRNLRRFVEEGGGYIGHCGGGTIPIRSAYDEQRTWTEYLVDNCYFIDSDIKVFTHIGMPILSEYGYRGRFWPPWKLLFPVFPQPEYIGNHAYMFYGKSPLGAPINFKIRDADHPILQDCLDDTFLARWGCGPAYVFPFDNLNISNLLDYPWEEDPYLNESTRITAWSFNETLPLVKFWLAFLFETTENLPYLTDWDKTTIPIKTEHANRSALVAFNYPEGIETGGRMVLSSIHPEISIWDRRNNSIKQANESDDNFLGEPLINWEHCNNHTPDPACWFIRREVAWASGLVPDANLPPVYGRSQVVDIDPILQESSEFTITCTVGNETDDVWEIANLSLYYRYTGSNSNYEWTNWEYYDSDYSFPWQFTFNANAGGAGNYEFYSILNTTNATGNYTCEFPSPGADAECVVEDTIAADFRHKPGTAYVNHTVYFYSESRTAQGSHITLYSWDFGDGCSITAPEAKNVTHKFVSQGIYTVTHSVRNNLSHIDSTSKTITVLNVPPIADFCASKNVIRVGETINFTDNSTDPDGTIVNWSWDFGDYSNSYEQNPSHTYSRRGCYPVTLEVTDNNGMTDSKCKIDYVLVVYMPMIMRLKTLLLSHFLERLADCLPILEQILNLW